MRKLLLLIAASLLGVGLYAQNAKIKLDAPTTRTTCTNNSFKQFDASFSFNEVELTKVETKGGTFASVSIPGAFPTGEVGSPEVPAVRKLIAVPVGATPVVRVKSFTEQVYSLNQYGSEKLMPHQPSMSKSDDPEKVPFAYNAAAYARKGFVGQELTQVEMLGTMRGVRIAALTINPVQYDVVANQLKVRNNIEIEVSFQGADEVATQRLYDASFSPYFETAYKQLFNRDVYTDHGDLYNTPVRMLVVAGAKFKEALKPWLTWKAQKGFYLDVHYTDEAEVGTTNASIKAFIHKKYNDGLAASAAPVFLALVGDTDVISGEKGKKTKKVTDLYYSAVDGDYFPEMYTFRMSASSPEELTNIIDKVLMYEKATMPDKSYLEKALLIAGADSYWNPKIGQQTIKYAVQYYYNQDHGYTDVYSYPKAPYTGCYSHLNTGVGFANYTAHGSETSWADPSVTATQVKALTNKNKYFLAIGNCCVTAQFDYPQPCFGEVMTRVKEKGAYAYIGSSPNSYWGEDYYWSVGANAVFGVQPTFEGTSMGSYDATFLEDSYNTVNSIMWAGNLAATHAENIGNVTHIGAHYYWEAYHVLGDGSVMPYRAMPKTNTYTLPASLPQNQASYSIQASAGSYVAISKDGVLYGTGVANASGVATVNMTKQITENGNYDVVITRSNYLPVIKQIQAGEPSPYQPVSNLTATTQGQKVTLKWDAPSAKKAEGSREVKRIGDGLFVTIEPANDVRANEAKVVLAADNVWGDNTGYQFLLDADHNTFGSVIPATGPLFTGTASSNLYSANFEYLIPANADPVVTTQNIIVTGQGEVVIPGGVYDYCITNPEPASGKMWIAGDGGNQPARYDDFTFEAGKKYTFTMRRAGMGDGTDMEVEDDSPASYTYTVYRDGTKIKEGLTATTFEEDGVAAGNHEYCVEVKYTAGVSPKVCKDVTVEGSNEFAPVQNLTGSAVGQKVTLKWDAPNGTPNPNPNPNPGTTTLSESFENGIPASWKTIDADGDGHGWKPGNAPGIAGYNSNGCVYSESFGLGGIGVLTPDNYLITPALDLPNGGKLTFWVCAQDANYASEHYAVYASSTGNDASNFTNALLEETITAKGVRSPEAIRGRIQGTWRQKTVDLPAGTKYVAFRHFQSTDMFYIDLDEVEIKANGKRADFTETFESSTHGEAPAEWTTIDADGDGQGWLCLSSGQLDWLTAHGGTNVVASFSWNGMALNPDNYLISKDVTGATKVKYYYAVNDGFPGDHYAVMISKTGTNAGDFTVVFEETPNGINKGGARFGLSTEADGAKPQSVWIERTVDLPAGTKYVAFRHYNCSDLNYILLDDIQFTMGGSPTPTDYTYTVYRDGTKIKEGLTETTFEEDGVATGNHEYCVEVKYTAGVSPKKCVNVTINPTQFNPVKNLKAQPDGGDVVLKWEAPSAKKAEGSREVKRIGDGLFVTIEPANDVRANEAKVVLAADNVWGDNTGYQFLLDADHNTFGSVIPATGPLFTGTASSNLYSANFEYLIPANADPVVTTQNIIVTGQGEVVIPGGVYDYCITNPEPASGKMWIAGDGGNQPARYDDFTFEAGKKYTFTMRRAGMGDGTDMEVEDDSPASYTYTVYRDGTKIKEGLTETTYRDAGMSAQSHEYCVEVKYAAGVSPKVCVDYIPDGVADVTAQKPYTLTVVGKTITVTCQGEAMIYDMNGRRLAAGRNTVVYTAQGGYYAVMVVVDGKSYVEKLAVK
uniref:Lys-gingipain HG66 n=2 Tax=Porphyromonas gingivalis TaxID=837 RepID=KGP66_PORGN|nr:RecName: Full=Lys-gingipain HG66; Contains: RecName: Full=Lys-gingipain catalytic subunit; Contains: RecName: Full=39 kDa adhesin; Contains: RecName: Full=15 kDa adhesin; Contains: RecName: Full=44 kDa adhesin; Flags: Precursor [Porphyromonas gingivalis]AAA99810.1 Lys-gingipain [Porphyromonas gingivalis]